MSLLEIQYSCARGASAGRDIQDFNKSTVRVLCSIPRLCTLQCTLQWALACASAALPAAVRCCGVLPRVMHVSSNAVHSARHVRVTQPSPCGFHECLADIWLMGGTQDPTRSLLGAQQKAYLKDQLSAAQSGGQIWKIIGQQVRSWAPRIVKTSNKHLLTYVAWLPAAFALSCGLLACMRSGTLRMTSRCTVALHHPVSAAAGWSSRAACVCL